MIIRLEFSGGVINEVKVADIGEEITIGRHDSCTWVIPREDTVASSKHAAITIKGGKPWLHDLSSTNGIYNRGKKITRKSLEPGDRISIGDCILAVDNSTDGDGQREPSRLVMLSGPQKGRKYDLDSAKLTIGSAPSSSLVLLDMLVSKCHAEINMKEDGSCWIVDLGSKNGSSVNGMVLRGDQERMLKDGDRISIAQFEMLFQDGAVKHGNSQVWLRLGVIAATLAIVLGGYWAYQQMRPSSSMLVKEARTVARTGDFTQAREILQSAATARNAAQNEIERADLLRNLTVWETTDRMWRNARQNLAAANWIEASRSLGSLFSGKADIWAWSDKAMDEKEMASRAKVMLDNLTRSTAALRRDDVDVAELGRNLDDVKQSLAFDDAIETPEYLEPLQLELVANRQELSALVEKNAKLDEKLQLLLSSSPPYSQIVEAFELAMQDPQPQMRKRAAMLLGPVKAMAESSSRLDQMTGLIQDMKFTAALAVDINLPSAEMCAVDVRLSQKRQEFSDRAAYIRAIVSQIGFLYREMVRDFTRTDQMPLPLAVWNDADIINAVMACDIMAKPLPTRSRNEAESHYDRALGTEEFYEFLRALPEKYDSTQADLPFPSLLSQAESGLQKTRLFVNFAMDDERKWLLEGQLLQTVEECLAILEERDEIVENMVNKAQASSGRTAVIAGGIAMRLADRPSEIQCGGVPLPEWVTAKFRDLRVSLASLNNEYSRSVPQRQIEIRGEILQLGLPGDPVVRRMWAARDAAGN